MRLPPFYSREREIVTFPDAMWLAYISLDRGESEGENFRPEKCRMNSSGFA